MAITLASDSHGVKRLLSPAVFLPETLKQSRSSIPAHSKRAQLDDMSR